MFPLKISTPDVIEEVAKKLITAYPQSKVFAFYGEMGAGKTTLIKALCRVLDVRDVTSSPSFGLINEYLTGQGDSIYHFDFFRIENLEEVFDIGYEEYIYSGDYCFLEWPELIEKILPDDAVRLSMIVKNDGSRELCEMSDPQ